MGADLVGDATAVVPNGDDQRQVDLRLLTRHRESQPVTERRRELDLAFAVARNLAGVLHEIEENLDELVAISEHVGQRSEEHTSELQSHSDLVCRLLLE